MLDFSLQVGSVELTVVNVHLCGAASAGEAFSSDEARCQRLPSSILETLKGQSVRWDQLGVGK